MEKWGIRPPRFCRIWRDALEKEGGGCGVEQMEGRVVREFVERGKSEKKKFEERPKQHRQWTAVLNGSGEGERQQSSFTDWERREIELNRKSFM
jgi:hypothetical protein